MMLERLTKEFGDAARAPQDNDTLDNFAPQAVLAPRDESAALEMVRFCGREKLAVLARGGGTKWHLGARPDRFDVLISTEHLNQVFEHDEGNATVSAGAGITLRALDEIVAERGQFVPLEGDENATLGGVVATNHFGAAKMRWGAPRDLVVGLNAILSDGRLIKAGSKVVKNVSGYDLNKLFIGSHGSLGLITQVITRLRPRDEKRAEWSANLSSWKDAEKQAYFLLDGAFEPALLQAESDGKTHLLRARFDGVAAAVEAQLARLPQAENQTEQSQTRAESSDAAFVMRAILPLRAASSWAQLALQSGAARIVWECANGAVRAEFASVPDVKKLRDEAEKRGGIAIVVRAPAELKTPDFVWGAPPSSFVLMRGLKTKFDSAQIFAPGRGIGGL